MKCHFASIFRQYANNSLIFMSLKCKNYAKLFLNPDLKSYNALNSNTVHHNFKVMICLIAALNTPVSLCRPVVLKGFSESPDRFASISPISGPFPYGAAVIQDWPTTVYLLGFAGGSTVIVTVSLPISFDS